MPDSRNQPNLKLFEANPSLFVENAIKDYVANSPGNRLTAFGGAPIFDDVVVGFADGDDTIFQDYKTIIGDFHLTPREIMGTHLQGPPGSGRAKEQPPRITVIAWALRFSAETRLSWRSETEVASLRVNHATWQGHSFECDQLPAYVISMVNALGYEAVPEMRFFKMIFLPSGAMVSNWSEKHAGYAAGLGTFGYNTNLITPLGSCTYVGSLVTSLPLPPTPRMYKSHLANCLFYRDGSCGRCIERCPSGALTKEGYDHKKCLDYHKQELPKIVKRLGRKGYYGEDPGCGMCTVKVPCEYQIPPDASGKNK
jgi:ferredoxin